MHCTKEDEYDITREEQTLIMQGLFKVYIENIKSKKSIYKSYVIETNNGKSIGII